MARLLQRLATATGADEGSIALREHDDCEELASLQPAARNGRSARMPSEFRPWPPVGSGGGPHLAHENGHACIRHRLPMAEGVQLDLHLSRRARPPLTARELETVTALLPWIGDHALLWWAARSASTRAARLEDALDRLPLSLVLVASDCGVQAVNASGSAMLAASKTLAVTRGRLMATDVSDDIRLKTVVYHAAQAPLVAGQRSTQVMRLKRSGQRPLVLAVSACGIRSGVDGATGDLAVLVQVIDPDLDLARHAEIACAVHGITGSEARLARLLISGHSLLDAAAMLRVQPDTARTYLKSIFVKTGVNRQAALVQLLLTSMVREVPGDRLVLV